jgi:hypothetical protein
LHLPDKDLFESVVIADCSQNRRIGGKSDGRGAVPFESPNPLCCNMLGISRATIPKRRILCPPSSAYNLAHLSNQLLVFLEKDLF